MRAPPFYLAAAVMFWAWHAQVPVLGAAVALALEAPQVLRMRWRFATADFARVGDLCTWAFVILAAYLTFTKGLPIPILEIFRWLPLVLLPLMSAQLFSESGRVPLSAIFLVLRGGKRAAEDDQEVDLSFPYVVVCALSAGAANLREDTYYAGLALLTAWGLWRVRSPRYPRAVWVSAFLSACAIGYAGHLGLSRLQQIAMDSAQSMFFGGNRVDPYRSTTDIGEIGELKQSGRIVLRVAAPKGMRVPLLVHTASYNAYMSPSWLAINSAFVPVNVELDQRSWVLAGAGSAGSRVVVSQGIERGKAVLALPIGTQRIEQLPAAGMQRNPLGTVEIESREDLVSYHALFDAHALSGDPPQAIDLRVPRKDAAVLGEIAGRLRLTGRPARESMEILGKFFGREFTYSTYLARPKTQNSPLADFLLVTRAGHCEYFATATALLLRAAGIPARYATGYFVQEWSPLEERYIARERHAHAWVQVWADGRWVDFDTTPPVWFTAEAEGASRIQRVADLWSWAMFRYTQWQNEDPNARTITALILILPLTGFLIWRLLIQQPLAVRRASRVSAIARRDQPGADSEFYEIEARLAGAGCARAPHEPLGAWLVRVGRERADVAIAPLMELLQLHYRYRFDPLGLNAEERRALAAQARHWLQAHTGLGAARQ